MKHIVAFVIALGIFSSAYGQTSQIGNNPTDTTKIQILEELKAIHQFQLEERAQREKDIEEWRSSKGDNESIKASPSDIGMMAKIEDNTHQHPMTDGWNFYGWIAFVIALASAIISFITLKEQSKTEKHTQKAPKQAQTGVLLDMPRHFYRNLACTCAALLKFRHLNNTKDGVRLKYPSEANILKLTTLPDEFILPIDSTDADVYQKMHEEKLLFKNYNMEISVAAMHFARKGISDNSLKNDYDNLLFKPFYLTSRMFELQDKISDEEDLPSAANVSYALYAFLKEHFEKVNINTLIDNVNGEINKLREILWDEEFIQAIGLDQNNNSIERGLQSLLKYGKEDKAKLAFLMRSKNPNNENAIVGIIDRAEFVEFFGKRYDQEEKNKTKGIEYLKKVISVVDTESFCAAFDKKGSPAITEFYEVMKPYFDFFQKKEWNVKDMVFTILKVDTVLELQKIGMIDYE